VIRTDDANLTSLFEKIKFEELLRSYLGNAMPMSVDFASFELEIVRVGRHFCKT